MDQHDSIPLELGDFEIIRQLGQGQMGVVYEALEASHSRRVALKTLSQGLGLTTQGIRRFRRDLEAASKLDHSHIVPIYSFGELGLVPYYAMQLVEGPSLESVIRGLKAQQIAARHPESHYSEHRANDLSSEKCPDWALQFFTPQAQPAEATVEAAGPDEAVESPASAPADRLSRFELVATKIADVADALAYAHEHGVPHRNLKPSNLLLAPDGRLCLSDFELASSLEQPGMTISKMSLTSPFYLAPEQVSQHHNHHPVDHRADVYALGAVMYELLTLHKPFDGQAPESVGDLVLHAEVASPHAHDPQIPQDLETICMKALEKEPGRRYQSAEQMATDLRRFAGHRGITAERIGWWGRSARWTRRHWATSSAAVLALVAVGYLGVFAYQQFLLAREAGAERLVRSISRATLASLAGEEVAMQAEMEEARRVGAESWLSHLLLGQLRLYSGRPELAIEPLEQALESNPDNIQSQSLLENVFSLTGKREAAHTLQEVLLGAVPATTRDKLYLGNWLSRHDPRGGLAMIEEANREAARTESTLARLYLAQARWRLAQDSGDPSIASLAERESRLARELLRNNGFAWLVEFQALRISSAVLRAAGRAADADQLEQPALESLQTIDELFPNSQAAAGAWSWQAYFLDDSDARLQAFRKAIEILDARQVEQPGNLRLAHALELFLQGSRVRARQELEALQANNQNYNALLCAILTADEEGNVAAAKEELDRLPPPEGIAALYRPLGWLMLGNPDQAQQLYQQLGSDIDLPPYKSDWYRQLLGYCRDTVSEEELMDAASGSSPSNLRSSEAHFFVAMRSLSQGLRQEARTQFEQCLQAGIFMSPEYQISRAVLKKWDSDPEWPSWIASSEP